MTVERAQAAMARLLLSATSVDKDVRIEADDAVQQVLSELEQLRKALETAYQVIDWYAFDTHNDEGRRARGILPIIEEALHPLIQSGER